LEILQNKFILLLSLQKIAIFIVVGGGVFDLIRQNIATPVRRHLATHYCFLVEGREQSSRTGRKNRI